DTLLWLSWRPRGVRRRASLAFADGSGDPAAVKNDGGKYYDKEGNPTIQGAERRDGGLVHLFRIPPLSLRIAMSVMVPTAKDRGTPARITLCGYAVIPISASSRMAVSVARPLSVSVYAPLSRLCAMNPRMAMDCIAWSMMPTEPWAGSPTRA